MSRPDSGTTRSKIHHIFSTRLTELATLGIHDLIFEHGNPINVGADGLKVASKFSGEANVVIVASRSTQVEGIIYREDVILEFDGIDLVIYGAQQVFSGKIPADETTRNKIIGGAIRKAFDNPKRFTEINSNSDNREFPSNWFF